jgi:hypothetical protein
VPAEAPAAREAKQYYGEFNGIMPFTAAAAGEGSDAVRVITLNEFGIKLADMTVSAASIDVQSFISFFPKRAVNALGKFYRDFYFSRAALIKRPLGGGKISYNSKDERITLWTENDDDN